MTHCLHSSTFLRRRNLRQDKRLRMLKKMANMRAAKERKRLANPIEREPKLIPWHPLELGIRDKISGEIAWVDFKSLRDAARRLAAVRKFYKPGKIKP